MSRHLAEPIPPYLTRQQVADLFGVSVKCVREWETDGLIPPPIRISTRTHRFNRDVVLEHLRKLQTGGPSPKAG